MHLGTFFNCASEASTYFFFFLPLPILSHFTLLKITWIIIIIAIVIVTHKTVRWQKAKFGKENKPTRIPLLLLLTIRVGEIIFCF